MRDTGRMSLHVEEVSLREEFLGFAVVADEHLARVELDVLSFATTDQQVPLLAVDNNHADSDGHGQRRVTLDGDVADDDAGLVLGVVIISFSDQHREIG